MATPSLAMIPSAYADSKVYSVLPNNGDGDFTFNRDSSATRVGQNGLIQTVGFFGNEEVTNGNFATDSDWVKAGQATISGGVCRILSTSGAFSGVYQTTLVVGKTYALRFDITSSVSGSLKVGSLAEGGSDIASSINSLGTKNFTFTATGTVISFARSSGVTDISIDNVSVKEVLGDQPRLNYDISNGVVQSCPSLLLEPQSTNSFPNSEDFGSGSGWTLQANVTLTSNSAISPDGTLNATKLVGNGTSGIYRYVTVSGVISKTIYIKSVVGNVNVKLKDPGGTAEKTVNVTTQWQRFDIIGNNGTSTSGLWVTNIPSSGIYIWGAQLEQQSYATSYIPTNGASQTRAAESCQKTGLTNYIGQTEGTLYAEIDFKSHPETGSPIVGIVTLNNNVSNLQNCIVLGIERLSTGVNRFYPFVQVGNSTTASVIGSTLTDGIYKAAFAYKENDFVLYVNGVQIGVDTSGAVPTTSQVLLAERFTNDSFVFGDGIKSTQIFKTRLTNAQLQTLTTL